MKKYIFKLIDEYFINIVKKKIKNAFIEYDIDIIFEEEKNFLNVYFKIERYPDEEIKIFLDFINKNHILDYLDDEYYEMIERRFNYMIENIKIKGDDFTWKKHI